MLTDTVAVTARLSVARPSRDRRRDLEPPLVKRHRAKPQVQWCDDLGGYERRGRRRIVEVGVGVAGRWRLLERRLGIDEHGARNLADAGKTPAVFQRPLERGVDRQREPVTREQLNEQLVVRLEADAILQIVQRESERHGGPVRVLFGSRLHAQRQRRRGRDANVGARQR